MEEFTTCSIAFISSLGIGLAIGLPFFAVRKSFSLALEASSYESRD